MPGPDETHEGVEPKLLGSWIAIQQAELMLKFVQKHPPVMRHPQDCILTADATYDTSEHCRLVLNLYAKK
jgi:hypothetical protein